MRVLFAHCPDSLVARLPRQKKTKLSLAGGIRITDQQQIPSAIYPSLSVPILV